MTGLNSPRQKNVSVSIPERAPRAFVSSEFFSEINILHILEGLKRTRWKDLSLSRILRGGRISDLGRTRRYALLFMSGMLAAWLPSLGYIKYGAVRYTSHFSLILPGAGSNTSVNISDIGQATSTASSPFSASSISPTVTYKNLIFSANVLNAAARSLNVPSDQLSAPTIKLVDETSFIGVEMTGSNPVEARDRARAIQDAFFIELEKLRNDELKRREDSTVSSIKQYEVEVGSVREKINRLQVKSGLNSMEQYNSIVAASEALKAKISEAEGSLAKVESSAKSLEKNLKISPAEAVASMKLHADPEFTSLADATAKMESDYAEAKQQLGANHPKLIDTRSKFFGARTKMFSRAGAITGLSREELIGKVDFSTMGQRSSLMIQLVNLETERQGLKAQLEKMQSQLNQNQKYVASLATVVSKLDILNRDYKLAEAVFTSALGRITTSKSDIFASYPMAQVVEAATIPAMPSSPNKAILFGASTAASVFLVFACLLGWMRRPLIDKLLKKIDSADGAKNAA
jgi:uncharacterized protein involved in exopolysaccharide biosynthesis